MQLTKLLQISILLASQAVAAPVDSAPPGVNVVKATPEPVLCGPLNAPQAWTLEAVQNSFAALEQYGILPDPQKPAAGGRVYPRQYGSGSRAPTDPEVVAALDAIPECKTNQPGHKYYEFPLDDPVFTGGDAGSQGPDRVVAISPSPGQGGTRTFTYCLAMTHRGGTSPSDPSFRPCHNVVSIFKR